MSLSELKGPHLDVPPVTLWEAVRSVQQKYADQAGLACLHQPANYLSEIFDEPFPTPVNYLKWTYAQLGHAIDVLAAGLYRRGVRPGMTVVTYCLNGAEWELTWRAAAKLNCRFAALNPGAASNSSMVVHYLRIADANVVLAKDTYTAGQLEQSAPEYIGRLLVKLTVTPAESSSTWDGFEAFMRVTASARLPDDHKAIYNIERSLDDSQLISFTSGSTALPKACCRNNRQVLAMLYSTNHYTGLDSDSSSVHVAPNFFIAAIWCSFGSSIVGGQVVVPSPTMDPSAFLDAFRLERITFFSIVPSVLFLLARHPSLSNTDTSHVRRVVIGGSTVLPSHMELCQKLLHVSRCACGYGTTEAGAISGSQFEGVTPGSPNCSLGPPLGSDVHLKLCLDGARVPLPRGQPGEIHVSSPAVIDEYLDGEATDAFYVDESGRKWFCTGDLCVMAPNGELSFVGRSKDMIIRGGSNISPLAIETSLQRLTGAEVFVVGATDEFAGEVPVAVVRFAQNQTFGRGGLREAIVTELGPEYAPEKILLLSDLALDDWPRADTGKVRKVDLKAAVERYMTNLDEQVTPTLDMNTVMSQLSNAWMSALGVDELNRTRSVFELGDSLSFLRLSSILERKTGQKLTLLDISEYPTIEGQARLLTSRLSRADIGMIPSPPPRNGPPRTIDMVHTQGREELANQTEVACNNILNPLGLSFADVKDVVPLYGLAATVLEPLRNQSWNNTGAFVSANAEVVGLRRALEKTLENHDPLRCMAIKIAGQDLHVIMKPSTQFFSACIAQLDREFSTLDELRVAVANDKDLNHASAPGPLFRAVIAPIAATHTAGLVYTCQHSTLDALGMVQFVEDLNASLQSPSSNLPSRIPYKLWADNLYNQRYTDLSMQAIEYHVARLTGVSMKTASLYPLQRNPVFVRRITPYFPQEKRQRNPHGQEGLQKNQEVSNMSELQATYGIGPSVVARAALAVLNVRQTNTSHALFAEDISGRNSWPFLPTWISQQLPLPMNVNGPTFEHVINCIEVKREETILNLLQRLRLEQEKLSQHCHADFKLIRKVLNGENLPVAEIAPMMNATNGANGRSKTDNTAPAMRDGDAMLEIWKRQLFNWLPHKPNAGAQAQMLQHTDMRGSDDNGLLFNFWVDSRGVGADAKLELGLRCEWDDEQLTFDEADALSDQLLHLVKVFSQKSSWTMPVGQAGL